MSIDVKGPDGSSISFPDGTPQGEILAALDKHYGPAPEGSGEHVDNIVRAAGRGVPIVGGLLNKADAALNAALAPVVEPALGIDTGPKALSGLKTFGERYDKSLGLLEGKDKAYGERHPVESTVAELTGGLGPIAKAVSVAPKLFGAVGTLPQMVARGAGSGAALTAADAATRGGDPVTGAELGGALGALGPLAGRAAGAVYRAVKGSKVPAGPANVTPVAGVDIPIPPQDAGAAGELEVMRRGGRGDPARLFMEGVDAERDARLGQATGNIGSGLDQSGAVARTTPQAAAERVTSELAQTEAQRAAAEASRLAAVRAEEAGLRGYVGGQGGTVLADSPYAAAERVGTGVTDAAARGRADFRGRYAAVAAEPGEVVPGAFSGAGERIRERLNAAPDRVSIDPINTPSASQAIRDIDTNVGLGNFLNEARPRGPAGPGGGAGPATEASRALDELTAMGVNPDRARAAVAHLPGGESLGSPALSPHTVVTPGGISADVAPKVVEARSIRASGDPGYDPALQPRNRARVASDVQVRDIAENLNPQRLGHSAEADRGAPIIGPDGMVESGNGRVMAIRQAYERGGPAADRYRQWLSGQGVDVTGFKEPVLVRERTTPMDAGARRDFTRGANESSGLSLSAPERALADARIVTGDSLSLIRNPADLGAVENRDFVRRFISQLPQGEQGAMLTASGDLSSEGLSRVRNAVLARAYGDSPILTRIAESTSDDVKSISNALVASAPEWAALRAAIAKGEVPAALDATEALVDAVSRTARIRARGVSLADATAQTEAFGAQSPESAAIQRLFYDADGHRAASAGQISEGLRHYAQQALKADAAPGLDLGLAPVKATDILESAAARAGAPKALAPEVMAAANAPPAAPAVPAGRPVDLEAIDSARKRLVSMKADARRSNNPSDVRAMNRIIDAFDEHVVEVLGTPGAFSGDAERAATLMSEARASRAAYGRTFQPRGPGDEVGSAVERILGRYPGQQATPAEIATLSYGNASDPGGGKAIKVAQRLREIVGPTSPEWGAYKQGLFAHLTQGTDGAALAPAKAADRIDKFLNGTQGRGLAHAVLSPEERTALGRYGQNLRTSEPVPLSALKDVDALIARISGRDGGPPASTTDIVEWLYGRAGKGGGLSVRLAQRLKADMTPEGFDQVRQGMWTRLTDSGGSKTDWGSQKISERIAEFLNESGRPLAHVLFTPAERAEMARLAAAHKLQVPPPGTINSSGTAPMLAKMGSGLKHSALPILGLMHGGPGGAIVGYGLDKGVSAISNARAAKTAANLYYGKQPVGPVDPRFAKAGTLIAQGSVSRQPVDNRR